MSEKKSKCFQNGLHLRFLRESWEVGDFTDVTLVADDGSHVEAHRLVLGLHSSVFSKLFKLIPSSSCQTHILVYLRGVKRTCLDLLLRLMYMGEVVVERDMVEEFIALGKELKIDIEGVKSKGLEPMIASVKEDFEHIAANGLDEPSLAFSAENADERSHKVASWDVDQSNDYQISAELKSAEEKKEVESNATPILNEWLNITEDDISEAQPNDAVVQANNDNERKSIIDKQQIFETSLVQSIVCKQCGSNFKTKKGLWFHTQSKHLGVTHKCDECEKVYNVKPALDRHKNVVHKGIRYKCDQCPVMLYTPRALRNHLKRHSGEKEPCDVCDKVFSNYAKLRRHKNQDHLGSSVEMYFCNICDWSGTRRQLSIHKQSIHEGVVFKCDNCDFEATQRGSLVSHMAKHEENKFKCNMCEKSFRQEAVLTKHMQSAHEGVWHFCNECDRSFSLLSSLSTHKTCIHQNTTQQSKKTKSKKSPRRKLERLVNQSCDQSDLSTTTNFELKKLVRQQSQIAEFNCQMCESMFKEKQKLDIHVKNKHDGVSYNCDKCKFKSGSKMDLVAHKETVHIN